MSDLNSYSQFLEKAREIDLTDLKSEHWENQINQGKYYKYFKESKPGIYVLDYTKQAYLYCNDLMASFADHQIPEIMDGGLDLTLKLWHPVDLNIYDQYILPANIIFLKSKSAQNHGDYLFTCSFRIRHRKGNYVRIEQASFFSKSYDGMPVMSIGFLRDITNRTIDNTIIHTIEHVKSNGNELLYRKIYNPDADTSLLTPRELEILELISQGKDSKQIASILGIEKNTVDNHRKNMLRKTNSQNMVQVALYAYKTSYTQLHELKLEKSIIAANDPDFNRIGNKSL